MKNYRLTTKDTEELIFSGFFKDFKTCLEEAIIRKTPLHKINLSGKNLTNANLDDAMFGEADFTNANLTGVNISESYCQGATFENTSLFNTCFAYPNLKGCNFKHASFGATDMSAALIDHAQFSTLSAFTIDFTKTRQMRGCTFESNDGEISILSKPPIVINGLRQSPVIILDDHIYNGHRRIDITEKEKYVKIN